MAVKSVIYHELLHQELVEHNKELYKKERIFPNLSIYKSELKKFFDSILEDQLLDPPNRFGEGKTIIFYELPNEDYLNDIVYYNKKLYVFQDKETTFSDEILNVNNPFVIWIVLKEGIYYICKRQLLFHKYRQLIFHKKRQLKFHTYRNHFIFCKFHFVCGFMENSA
jgi:hypothetical protein